MANAAVPDERYPVTYMDEAKTRRMSILSANKAALPPKPPVEGRLEGALVFRHRTRFLIMLLATLCMTLVVANSVALNFTVICMFDEKANLTGTQTQPKMMYSDAQQSWLFSAIAIGTLAGTIPISYLHNRFGVRLTFTVYGFTSAVSTMLLPLAASWGFGFVLFLRIVEGFAVATSFPAMGAIVTEWASLKRSGTYVAYLSTHLQLGPILAMPLAGELCESSLGWGSLYYFLGAMTAVAYILFYMFFRDSPVMHRNVSNKELAALQRNKVIRVLGEGERPQVPYRRIFTDFSVLGIFASGIGGSFGFQLFVQYGPFFLNKILKFDVKSTGFAAALAPVLSMCVKFIAGPLSDHVPYLNDKWRVIMFATISQFAMAFCFLALAFMPEEWGTAAQICYTGSIMCSGLNCVGTSKSTQLISGRHSHVLMAVSQFIMSFMVLILPAVVTIFAPDNTREEWSHLFIFTALLVFVTTIAFDVTAEGTPRGWAIETDSPARTESPPPATGTNRIVPTNDKFDIPRAELADVAKVEHLLQEKRLSIISRGSTLNGSLRSVSKRPGVFEAMEKGNASPFGFNIDKPRLI